jgi:3-deoxy-D-manno-octulosonic-acid transferase
VTGTMKFDTAQIADRIDGDETLANEVGIQFGNEKVWLCGSTGPGEESLILEVYREILESHPTLRLVIVPRKPERFDEVAAVIESAGFGLIRRSTKSRISNLGSQISDLKSQISAPVILGDTMGELRKFYSLADVVFVGRTLVDLGSRQHGSDMIEPAALAKPVIIGPFTANFAEVMNKLRHAEGICEVFTPGELKSKVAFYLDNAEMGRDMGNRGQAVVRQEQGATARHAAIILDHLPPPENNRV